jgi:hypothetical protein
MAFEENAIFFYETFLKRFPSDTDGVRVRTELSDLYLGRHLFAEAGTILNQQIASRQAQVFEKESAALKWMRMEVKYGTLAKAAQIASTVTRLANNGATKAEALAIQSRNFAVNGRLKEVAGIEAELKKFEDQASVQEFLGEVRFLIATATLKPVLKPIDNLQLRDPRATVASRMRDFNEIKASYERVCETGETSFCVPSLFRTARIADQLVTILEDVTIPPTLAASVVKAFEAEKSKAIEDLSKLSVAADAKAQSIASHGYTQPDWIQQVYWQNSADMNFERVSGEEGRAYIQWPVSSAK